MVDRDEARATSRRLFDEFARGVDGARRERIVEEIAILHRPLVAHIARRFADRGEPLDDLVQVGMLALVRAVDRFDPALGNDFASFLTPTVVGEIKRYFRDHAWTVRVPRGLQELRADITSEVAAFSQEHGRAPSVPELAERLDCTIDHVLEGLEAGYAYNALPLDVPAGDGLSIGDRLADPDDPLTSIEWQASLSPVVNALPVREQRILRLRFVDGWSQAQIAAEIGVSQMHVSRLLARTLAHLREQLGPSIAD